MAARWVCYGALVLTSILSSGSSKPQLSTYLVNAGSSVVNGSLATVTDGCDKMEEYNWYSDFHDCFVDRKYKDGGRDLDAIVDRILQHAEECVGRRGCRLDFGGFEFLMDKVIAQMKDFSVMYMEAVVKGREDVKDLECVEDVLSVQTYVECFASTRNGERSQSIVQEGLVCANRQNQGCSREAMTTLNRIVRTFLGQKHPESESFAPSTTTPPSFDWRRFEEPTPAPPMMWYDYIFQPLVSAWNWVKSLFG